MENNEIYKKFTRDFENVMCSITNGQNYSNIIFLCIGSQNIIGDSFGPFVGTRLSRSLINANRLSVIGTLENTVSLCNINNVLRNIQNKYTNPFIIAIDSALSDEVGVGKIIVATGGIKIGSSLNRQRLEVGDMGIKAVVGRNSRSINKNLAILRSVPLSFVENLSNIVATGIYNTINYQCNE